LLLNVLLDYKKAPSEDYKNGS